MEKKYIELMNNSIYNIFKSALKISFKKPLLAFSIFKMIFRQKKMAKLRLYWKNRGLHVPPFMIASITKRCNLKCKGCYALTHANNKKVSSDLPLEKWHKLFKEARELGISLILLGGGEPFIRKDVINITAAFPEIIFPVFTNGLLINDDIIKNLKKQKNLIPIISLEGYESDTDNRRGKGVHNIVLNTMERMKDNNIFFGTSLTVTRNNFNAVTNDGFIKKLVKSGCRLFFFVEYIPVKEDTENLVITKEQRIELEKLSNKLYKKFNALFIAFPTDESKFGGCLSSGRGFVHISPEGDLEPCPFSPYSDVNLNNTSLKLALQSKFFKILRNNKNKLSELDGGCALWTNRDWVYSILNHINKDNEDEDIEEDLQATGTNVS